MSAGVLLYREAAGGTEVFLGRMGGPFWTRRPRAWSIPKGLQEAGEAPLDTARREYEEEIGAPPPTALALLGVFRQNSAKTVTVFAGRGEESTVFVSSTTVELEWPRGSGVFRVVPEIETARWLSLVEARGLIVAGQVPVLDALSALLASTGQSNSSSTGSNGTETSSAE
ncbi:NUDIX domain-containing protein [Rathayibacter tanaceti]|nr:NUDIX domain-containing protein [Rathayibacter tanaceti]